MKSNLSFADTFIAFSYKSDQELKKSYLLFLSINNAVLSKLGANIMKFALKVKLPIKLEYKGKELDYYNSKELDKKYERLVCIIYIYMCVCV